MTYSLLEEKLLKCCFEETEKKEFEDLRVSVLTYMIYFDEGTNFDPQVIYKYVPVRKSDMIKVVRKNIETVLEPGSILNVKYKTFSRGVLPSSSSYFRNQATLVMSIEEKNVNIFVFKNCIKITGSKVPAHVISAVRLFVCHLKVMKRKGIPCFDKDPVIIDINPVMTNVDFHLGFKVDRQKLDNILNQRGYISIFENRLSNGVTLKIPHDYSSLSISPISNSSTLNPSPSANTSTNSYTTFGSSISSDKKTNISSSINLFNPLPTKNRLIHFGNHYESIAPQFKSEKISPKSKEKYHTFIIFQSGKVLQSGNNSEDMKLVYNHFRSLIDNIHPFIEQKLEIF